MRDWLIAFAECVVGFVIGFIVSTKIFIWYVGQKFKRGNWQ